MKLANGAMRFAAEQDLKPNEFRLLMHMCLLAVDDATPPKYWASRERSAWALGHPVPLADDDEEAARERRAGFQLVKVATRGLLDKAAIYRLSAGRAGRQAEFEIRVLPAVDALGLWYAKRTPGSTDSVPAGVRGPYPVGYVGHTPEEKSREVEEKQEEKTAHHTGAPHLWAVDKSEGGSRVA